MINEDKVRNADSMQKLAHYIASQIRDDLGFTLLIYEHGENGRMNYVSNSQREDVINTMKEFIANKEHKWGTHQL